VDHALGSPDNIIIVASSEAHADHFIPVHEERLTLNPARDLIRADMSYFEVPGGGAVFSTGSITFGGSFSHDNYENNISRIVRNVLARFRSNQA
jgi:N,N-dimethylformamidase